MATYSNPKFHFLVQWGGEQIGFTEVTGLDIQVEAIHHGKGPDHARIKIPGLHKFGNITMKRGTMTRDSDFFKWINQDKISRRDMEISLLNEKQEAVKTWKIHQACPVKVKAAELKSGGNEVAIETLEFAHEGLKMTN